MFFLIPLDRKPDWRNPPLVTLGLIIINTLFYVVWQHGDQRHLMEAYRYYEDSGLYRIEVEYYKDYRQGQATQTDFDELSEPEKMQLVGEMLGNGEFQKQLEDGKIITPEDEVYPKWKEKRDRFDAYRNKAVQYKYGLNPSRPTVLTAFTNMFLHGSFGHLAGNMVGLFLMGFVVEMVLGRVLFLTGYLLSGLLGDALYILLFSDQWGYGVGASGAVFGIMGMYLMLFGLRKIRFFYQFLFYFDYVKAPAIILAPFFILWQLYIQFVADTNINVSAHMGGFFGGVIVVLLAKRFTAKSVNTEYLDQNINEEAYQKAFQKGQQLLAAMKMNQARKVFEELHQQYPKDIAITQQLYNVAKYQPASEEFHRYAQQLLRLPGSDRRTVKMLYDVFKDYSTRAKPAPRLSPDLLLSLALRFASSDYIDDAEKLILYLLKKKRDFHRNAEGISALAKHYNGRNRKKFEYYRQLLLQLYPDSAEAHHIQQVAPIG
jgi:membrane associated rhomboid family serine protease